MFGQHFQNSAGDPESAFGGLVRIRSRADDDRLAIEELEMPIAAESQRSAQHFGGVFLDEDVPLAREPRRKFVVGFAKDLHHPVVACRPLHDVAMGVASVAVATAECAT